MSTIINIRGTNGSGKTTLVRELLGEWDHAHTPLPDEVVYAYNRSAMTAVGHYPKEGSGGLDKVRSFALQQAAVRHLAETDLGPVLCEGVLASTVFGSWAELFKQLKAGGHRVIVAYLDTPLQVCLARIQQRQEAAGKVREIKRDQVADKVRAIRATHDKFRCAGIETVTLDYNRAAEQVRELLR